MDHNKKVVELPLEDVLPNRFQPRIKFNEESIIELSESIKEHGVIQPIVVRPVGDKYEIIAGERRYKASNMAGLSTIPAIVTNFNDKESAEVALIENVQRKDLTPIEEAISYKKILDMGYLTQEQLATKLGKTQSTVANKLRLLNLDEDVQEALLEDKISERHARSLLKLNDFLLQKKLLNKIVTERLTVRKTDEEINNMLSGNYEENSISEVESNVVVPEVNPAETMPFDFNLAQETNPTNQTSENTFEIPKFEDFLNDIQSSNNTVSNNMENNTVEAQEINESSNPKFEEILGLKKEADSVEENQPKFEIPNFDNLFDVNTFVATPEEKELVNQGEENVDNFNLEENVNIDFEIPKFEEIFGTSTQENNLEESSFNNFEIPKFEELFVNNSQENNSNEIVEDNSILEKTIDNELVFTKNEEIVENKEVNDVDQANQEELFIPENEVSEIETPDVEVPSFTAIEEENLDSNPFSSIFDEVGNNYNISLDSNDIIRNDNSILKSEEIDTIEYIEEQKDIASPVEEVMPFNFNDINTIEPTISKIESTSHNTYVANDIKAVINTVHNCAETIKKYGFIVEVDEVELTNEYKITFSIKK